MNCDRPVWQAMLELSDPRRGPAAELRIAPQRWSHLFELARLHGVLGIVLHNLRSCGEVDCDARAAAEQLWQTKLARARVVRQHGDDAAKALAAAGVPVALFKGADFIDRLYPRPELRSMWDFDVLVPREQLRRAAAVLQALGYAELPAPPMRFAASEYGEQSWRHPASGIECDLHWNLINHPSQRRRASLELADLDWEECYDSGLVVRRATPATRLAIAAVHAAITHQFNRLLLLCDIRQACRLLTSEADLEALRRLARRARIRAALDVALGVTARVLHDSSAADVRRRLGSRAISRVGARLASAKMLRDRDGRTTGLRRKLLRELLKRAA